MKKFVTLLLLALALTAFAQDHMKFMGIPINGQLSTFCQALEKKGFTQYQMYSNAAVYSGLFTGRPAYVMVEITPKSKVVEDVVVIYDYYKWEDMEAIYDEIKVKLAAKYSEPVKVEELGTYGAHDYDLKGKIESGSIVRETRFETNLGKVIVGIDIIDVNDVLPSPHAFVAYVDKANQAKGEQEADDDL